MEAQVVMSKNQTVLVFYCPDPEKVKAALKECEPILAKHGLPIEKVSERKSSRH